MELEFYLYIKRPSLLLILYSCFVSSGSAQVFAYILIHRGCIFIPQLFPLYNTTRKSVLGGSDLTLVVSSCTALCREISANIVSSKLVEILFSEPRFKITFRNPSHPIQDDPYDEFLRMIRIGGTYKIFQMNNSIVRQIYTLFFTPGNSRITLKYNFDISLILIRKIGFLFQNHPT